MMVSSGMGLDRKEQPMEPIWIKSDGWESGETIGGIWRTEGGTYLARTYATSHCDSRTFETLRFAVRWMEARGFTPQIDLFEQA